MDPHINTDPNPEHCLWNKLVVTCGITVSPTVIPAIASDIH